MSKRMNKARESVDATRFYDISEAAAMSLQFTKDTKLTETMELVVSLGVKPTDPNEQVRSSVDLPHGTGKEIRVAVVANADQAEAAEKAGADEVGYEDLVEKLGKNPDFDTIIATPDAMKVLSKIGPILGPRGLMPNPKVGTVTMDVAAAVKAAKAGRVNVRTDKGGLIHCMVGRETFTAEQLVENVATCIARLKQLKPATSKGVYLKSVHLSSTMGPGIKVDVHSIPVVSL